MQLTQPGLASHALDTNRTLHRMQRAALQGSCSATYYKAAPPQFYSFPEAPPHEERRHLVCTPYHSLYHSSDRRGPVQCDMLQAGATTVLQFSRGTPA